MNSRKLSLRTNYCWLFGQKLIPAETGVFQPLLQRAPRSLLPVEAIHNGIAILHQCFFQLHAHLARMGSTQRRHLAIPAQAEIFANPFQPEKLPQCLEVLWLTRFSVVHPR